MQMLLVICSLTIFTVGMQADDTPDDVAVVRKAITTQNAKYSDAVNRQDVNAFLALFTDDATILHIGRTIKSKEEREKAAADQLAAVKDPEFNTTEVDVRGDLAYEVGDYTVTAREGGKKTTGSYLVVWKRQKDGVWKIHVEATLPGNRAER